jgi:hypothetical protein
MEESMAWRLMRHAAHGEEKCAMRRIERRFDVPSNNNGWGGEGGETDGADGGAGGDSSIANAAAGDDDDDDDDFASKKVAALTPEVEHFLSSVITPLSTGSAKGRKNYTASSAIDFKAKHDKGKVGSHSSRGSTHWVAGDKVRVSKLGSSYAGKAAIVVDPNEGMVQVRMLDDGNVAGTTKSYLSSELTLLGEPGSGHLWSESSEPCTDPLYENPTTGALFMQLFQRSQVGDDAEELVEEEVGDLSESEQEEDEEDQDSWRADDTFVTTKRRDSADTMSIANAPFEDSDVAQVAKVQ